MDSFLNANSKDWVKEYRKEIKKENIIVGTKIKKLFVKFDYDLQKENVMWKPQIGNLWITLMEEHFIVDGSGGRLKLTLPQKAQIQMFFSTIERTPGGDFRFYKELFLEVSRGYGKSTLSGALNAASFILNSSSREEFWNIAYSKRQATAVIKPTANIIRWTPLFQELGYEVKGSGELLRITNNENSNFIAGIRQLDANDLQGMDFASCIIDEVHTWKESSLRTDIKGGMKNDDAILITITTNGDVRGGYLDALLEESEYVLDEKFFGDSDNRLLPWVYTVDDYVNFWDEVEVQKANPNWHEDMFQTRRREIRNQIKKSLRLDVWDPKFLTTNLNMVVNSSSALLAYEDLEYDHTYDIDSFIEENPDALWFVGIDLGQTHDLTSVCLIHYSVETDELFIINNNWLNERHYDIYKKKNRFPIAQYKKRQELSVNKGKFTRNENIIQWIADWNDRLNIAYVGLDPKFLSDVKDTFLNELGWSFNNFLVKVLQSRVHEPLLMIQKLSQQSSMFFNEAFLKWQLLNIEIDIRTNNNVDNWLIDNKDPDKLHDAGSALATALMARYYYKDKYGVVDC